MRSLLWFALSFLLIAMGCAPASHLLSNTPIPTPNSADRTHGDDTQALAGQLSPLSSHPPNIEPTVLESIVLEPNVLESNVLESNVLESNILKSNILKSNDGPANESAADNPSPIQDEDLPTNFETLYEFAPQFDDESPFQLTEMAADIDATPLKAFVGDATTDLRNFYSKRNLPLFVGAFGIGAIMANSDIDQDVLEHIQSNITYVGSDEYQTAVSEFKFFGEGYYLLPVYAGTAILGKHFLQDHELAYQMGEWGERSFRGILIGTPPLLISQYVLGGSRPSETNEGSEWQFMGDDNGVSGHAFMGAVPFLTAAHMSKGIKKKAFFIVLSTIPALSRITENGHYPSQAFLGWVLAYAATKSVARTEKLPDDVTLYPLIDNNGIGAGVSIKH